MLRRLTFFLILIVFALNDLKGQKIEKKFVRLNDPFDSSRISFSRAPVLSRDGKIMLAENRIWHYKQGKWLFAEQVNFFGDFLDYCLCVPLEIGNDFIRWADISRMELRKSTKKEGFWSKPQINSWRELEELKHSILYSSGPNSVHLAISNDLSNVFFHTPTNVSLAEKYASEKKWDSIVFSLRIWKKNEGFSNQLTEGSNPSNSDERYPYLLPDQRTLLFSRKVIEYENGQPLVKYKQMVMRKLAENEWSIPAFTPDPDLEIFWVNEGLDTAYFFERNPNRQIGFVVYPNGFLKKDEVKITKSNKLTITSPIVTTSKKVYSTERNYLVSGQVEMKDGVIVLLINGMQIKFDSSGKFYSSVSLNEGDNNILVEAIDQKGNSIKEEFLITSLVKGKPNTNQTPLIKGRKDYALLIGVNSYDEWPDLRNPVPDARMIEKELTEIYGFETEVLENPTVDELLIKLKSYSTKKYSEHDQLFIFFAGHGNFDESYGEGYLVGKNSKRSDEALTSYLSHSRLRAIVDNIKCDHILLMIDACFGGTFDPLVAASERGSDETIAGVQVDQFIERNLRYKTRRYVTSGGKEYVSDGVPGNNSPFTRKLLEAFRNNGGNDKILTFNEIINFIDKVTPAPRIGEFGTNRPGSNFLFISKNR